MVFLDIPKLHFWPPKLYLRHLREQETIKHCLCLPRYPLWSVQQSWILPLIEFLTKAQWPPAATNFHTCERALSPTLTGSEQDGASV